LPRQIVTLAETSGLTDSSPLHRYLKTADQCLKDMGRQSWYKVHKVVAVIDLLAGMFHFIGHPVTLPDITDSQVEDFHRWLWEQGEIEFSLLCSRLHQKRLSANAIRLTLLYIFANLGLLKDKEDRMNQAKYRSIDDEWYGAEPETEWKSYLEPEALQQPESPVQ
jgi:hypothetical protein